jgi:hypothetical protein
MYVYKFPLIHIKNRTPPISVKPVFSHHHIHAFPICHLWWGNMVLHSGYLVINLSDGPRPSRGTSSQSALTYSPSPTPLSDPLMSQLLNSLPLMLLQNTVSCPIDLWPVSPWLSSKTYAGPGISFSLHYDIVITLLLTHLVSWAFWHGTWASDTSC